MHGRVDVTHDVTHGLTQVRSSAVDKSDQNVRSPRVAVLAGVPTLGASDLIVKPLLSGLMPWRW